LSPLAAIAQTDPPTPIVITSDGAVQGTDLIVRDKNLYTFTSNISGSIVIEKDGVVLDGGGYGLGGETDSDALTLIDVSNVTIRNLAIDTAGTGMILTQISDCSLLNVAVKAERAGIRMRNATATTITDSRIEAKVEYGLSLTYCPSTIITNNTIISTMINAVNCGYSPQCIIAGNNITYKLSQFQLAFGIEFDGSTDCIIKENIVTGFPLAGINLQSNSDSNQVEANHVMNGVDGIRVGYSKNNNLTGNVVADNNGTGLRLESASGNLLRGNRLSNNTQNFVFTSYGTAAINDVDPSNMVDGKPIIYWVNQADKTVPPEAVNISLINCTGITVEDFTFVDGGDCITLAGTVNSTVAHNSLLNNSTLNLYSSTGNNITQNVIADNSKGIVLASSTNNTLTENAFDGNEQGVSASGSSGNIIAANNFTGNQNALYFSGASNNLIYLNNFQNNTLDVGDWGNSYPYASVQPASSGSRVIQMASSRIVNVNFVGPPPLSVNTWDNGTVGNFWSSYNGSDANGDGIGDNPHYLYGNNQDNYPLMQTASAQAIPEFPAWAVLAAVAATVAVVALTKARQKQRE
jgi:parallel beta-helix repeat protein